MLAVHIWRVRKDGFAVQRPSAGAFAEEADRTARRGGRRRRASRPVRRPRVRLLGVVDRESVTAEDRAVDDTVFTWPHLLVRHVVVALGVAARRARPRRRVRAPLRGLANPNLTPEPAKAPWYFAGLQELLSHFDPLVAGILVPAGAVLACSCCCRTSTATATPRRGTARSRSLMFTGLLVIAVGLTVVGTFFRGPGWQFRRPVDPPLPRALGVAWTGTGPCRPT